MRAISVDSAHVCGACQIALTTAVWMQHVCKERSSGRRPVWLGFGALDWWCFIKLISFSLFLMGDCMMRQVPADWQQEGQLKMMMDCALHRNCQHGLEHGPSEHNARRACLQLSTACLSRISFFQGQGGRQVVVLEASPLTSNAGTLGHVQVNLCGGKR